MSGAPLMKEMFVMRDKIKKNQFDEEIQEYLDENIILYNDEDEAFEFEKVAIISLDEDHNLFHILKPIIPMDGVGEDEVIVFGYEDSDDGEEGNYYVVEDEEISAQVMETFYQLVEESDEV